MNIQHKTQEQGVWLKHDLIFQLANIGSEVIRALSWQKKGNKEYAQLAFERALELFDLTIADPKNRKRLKEVCRAREVVADFFAGDNQYRTPAQYLKKYFIQFNYLAAVRRGV